MEPRSTEQTEPEDNPLSCKHLLAGTIITVVGGVIVAIIIQEGARFAPKPEVPPTPTSSNSQTIYDNFNERTFLGLWNTELWEPFEDISNCKVAQRDGFLRFSCTKPTGSGLHALRYKDVASNEFSFIEARLMLDREIQTTHGHAEIEVVISRADNKLWRTFCGIWGATQDDMARLYCGVSSDRGNEYWRWASSVAYDTWHTVRVELNPELAELRYFIDGQQIGNYVFDKAHTLKEAKLFVNLTVSPWDGTLTTAYFDDVRIGQIGEVP